MSWWKRLFGSSSSEEEEPSAPSYAHLDDERLQQLWAERRQLTDEAREALLRERRERGLAPREPAATGTTPLIARVPADGLPPAPSERGAPRADAPAMCHVSPFGPVLLRAGATELVAVIAPLRADQPDRPLEIPPLGDGDVVRAVIVINDTDAAWLPASAIVSALGEELPAVYCTDPARPADRYGEAIDDEATSALLAPSPLPDPLEVGTLAIRTHATVPGALVVEVRDTEQVVFVGARVPLAEATRHAVPTTFIGGVALDRSQADALSDHPEALLAIRNVIVVSAMDGVRTEGVAETLTALGIRVLISA